MGRVILCILLTMHLRFIFWLLRMDLTTVQKIVIWAIPILFAITLHEVAHGWVASFFGDQTARFSGRLSLNPIKHIDPIGTILVPLLMLLVNNFMFGWAKPVPVDARNLRHPRRDLALVALAGPVANLIMALLWALIGKGGAILIDMHNAWFGVPLVYMGGAGMTINVVLAVLNLLPLPPLDGGKVLMAILPPRLAYRLNWIEPYSFLILIMLIFSGVLTHIMAPIILFILNLLSGIF